MGYADRVAKGLATARADAPLETVELSELKLAIYGDQHRGAGDGADDFRLCRQVYHAALGYYYRLGHTLVMPGDVEELWECPAEDIVERYRATLELESRFLEGGRYLRLIGNHDSNLRKREVLRHFAPYLIAPGNERPEIIHDAYRYRILDDGEELGELYVAHGHQGVNYSWYAVAFVKYLWTWVQRVTGVGYGIPSKHFEMRCKHERAMHEWVAALKDPVALVAGHTHFPVFMSANPAEAAQERLEHLLNSGADEGAIAEAEAAFQFILAEETPGGGDLELGSTPCYFNSGCCSFTGGEISGLEVENGEMRLVQWHIENDQPVRSVLRSSDLRDIFCEIQAGK